MYCRIVPVFSDLDARSLGTFEGTNAEESWKTIHSNDESDGINWRAPSATDGTPRYVRTYVIIFILCRRLFAWWHYWNMLLHLFKCNFVFNIPFSLLILLFTLFIDLLKHSFMNVNYLFNHLNMNLFIH